MSERTPLTAERRAAIRAKAPTYVAADSAIVVLDALEATEAEVERLVAVAVDRQDAASSWRLKAQKAEAELAHRDQQIAAVRAMHYEGDRAGSAEPKRVAPPRIRWAASVRGLP